MVKRKAAAMGSWDDWEPGGKGGNGGFYGAGMSEQQLGKLHDAIAQTAHMAVQEIIHLETDKSEGVIASKIVKSAYKAASEPKLMAMPREAAIQELVTRMMQGYSAAFGEAPWFFNINLPPVLCAAAWEIFAAKGEHLDGNIHELQDQVAFEYDAQLDRILLDRAMWEVAHNLFGDESTQNKIFQAISRSYWPALDEALGNLVVEEQHFGWLGPEKELEHVQAFAHKWINDSMCRAWVSIEGAERVLTRDTVLQLFQGLVCPWGPEDYFTCIPGVLTDQIGRPPPDWPFLEQAIAELFTNWGGGGHSFDGGASKKRKKAGANPWLSGEAEGSQWQASKPVQSEFGPKAKAKFRGFGAKEELLEEGNGEAEAAEDGGKAGEGGGGGHPLCTSDEDCIGNPECKLVQHILRGKPGDMYCQKCWDSFSARNASLQGVEVDI